MRKGSLNSMEMCLVCLALSEQLSQELRMEKSTKESTNENFLEAQK